MKESGKLQELTNEETMLIDGGCWARFFQGSGSGLGTGAILGSILGSGGAGSLLSSILGSESGSGLNIESLLGLLFNGTGSNGSGNLSGFLSSIFSSLLGD